MVKMAAPEAGFPLPLVTIVLEYGHNTFEVTDYISFWPISQSSTEPLTSGSGLKKRM